MDSSKGTVMPLSSLFPAEEALKASMRVQQTIDDRQRQLDQLRGFIDDNVSLINLVGRLPDETHHQIMVPFGKAAFFPGRLVHTNEFMVFLGEGYYSERSAKQTIEILKRRGKLLETQVQSLQSVLRDLKAEASFFDATAVESSEGLVEIREDYVDEGSSRASVTAVEVSDINTSTEDEEYQRIFSRMAELEKEEEEAAELGLNDPVKSGPESSVSKLSIDQGFRSSLVGTSEPAAKSKDEPLHVEPPAFNGHVTNKAFQQPIEKKQLQDPASSRSTAFFTGSIVEHDHNLGVNSPERQTGERSSKPPSRFKMQRKVSG